MSVVQQAARSQALALGHPIDVADGFLDEPLGFLGLPHVGRGGGQAGIGQAEVRVDLDGAFEGGARFRELAAGQRLHRQRVLAHDLERGRRQLLGREAARRVGGAVAEGRADAVAEIGGHAEDAVATGRIVGLGGDDVAGHALGGLQA